MAKKKSKNSTASNASAVTEALRQIVADTYALLGQTHLCHWNVEGPSFFALHTAFEAQYTELFAAVDELAERIRALGAYAPGGLGNLAKMAGFAEIKENSTDKEMVKHLSQLHRELICNAAKARDLAGDAGDAETEDLMVARIQVHEKTVWMLESYLK
ncbi:Dps family protein [Cerasicoccus arenae]|uniref:DNA starvation/stationary phase protection protein n=1 Tax=Cerasicoccus arenae TaxID=424488 RepID=A0A8J3GEI3_9BACT|nr:Dps family protein [Cerasicoccus arenae]MBK1857877.1 DNA starvation/stationary phase protection protein [Cerasicoccus arenae]GHC09408.1 DNA starvation/stationary phase protection protein [Cerasicoccus arenae]